MDAALQCTDITKKYGPVMVLGNVSFSVEPGEIHVLLGENGAGKSTLVKVASGVVRPDSGLVRVGGVDVPLGSVAASQAAGVALIHQEPRLFGDLDVLDNLFMGALPYRRWRLGVDRREAAAQATAVLARGGCRVPVDAKIRDLSVADRQLVDIASALLRNPSVLVVDEPTASLTPSEVDRLFSILRELKAAGVAIVFIGHRLEEIFAISDRITVLRDGRFVEALHTSETSPDELIRLMVGREPVHAVSTWERTTGDVLLSVTKLSSPGAFEDVSLEARAGEVVALAGLVGAGRSEVAEAIFGVRQRSSGEVRAGSAQRPITTSSAAIAAGVAYVPEDRGLRGLATSLSLRDNVTSTVVSRISRFGVRRIGREAEVAEVKLRELGVVHRAVTQQAQELSGGNQQKVSLAKWLVTKPLVLIVDEPTRGVDVGAKAEIHRLLLDLVRSGIALVLISSELPEILLLADRVVVLREGRIAGELRRDSANEESIMRLATGASTAEHAA